MKKKNYIMGLGICVILAAGMMAVQIPAEETMTEMTEMAEEIIPKETEAAEPSLNWEVTGDLSDGTYTISIKDSENKKEGYWWSLYTGDKGDATLYELVTQSSQEEGYAYVGSFRGLEDANDGEDYIRLVYTDGYVVDEYMDFNIRIEGGTIVESTGGSYAMPDRDEDMAPFLCGSWKAEENENMIMEISANPAGGFDAVISDKTQGEDAATYTFTAKHDAIQGAFLYCNGTYTDPQFTDETESEGEGGGTGLIAFDPASEDEEHIKLILHDLLYTDGADITFTRAE